MCACVRGEQSAEWQPAKQPVLTLSQPQQEGRKEGEDEEEEKEKEVDRQINSRPISEKYSYWGDMTTEKAPLNYVTEMVCFVVFCSVKDA